MSTPNLILEINPKNEIVRIARGRQSVIASVKDSTLIWKDELTQSTYRKSVDSFLFAEGIKIDTVLLEGQKPDIVPENARPAPAQHKMQGELTPEYLEWLKKWKPVAFQNLLGVQVQPGEFKSVSDSWVRADVIRTDVRPTEESKGGQYVATRFKMKNQIIARRASHLTFTPKEVFRGDTAVQQAEPYTDSYSNLERMDKMGDIEIVSRKNAAASAGSIF